MPVRTSSNSSSSQAGARRDAILAYLRERGGRIESPSGVGLTAAIADAVGYGDVGVLNGMLARLEQEGLIDRDIRGRRTFAISLASGGGQTPRARGGAARATATKAAPRSRGAGRGPSGDGIAQAAGALVDQLTALRGALDELSQRVASLESGGAAAPAPARKATAKKRAARKTAAKKATARKAAAKKTTAKKTTAKKAAAKKTTAKKAAAKKTTTRKAAAKKTAAKRTTAKKTAAKKATTAAATPRKASVAKRGAAKKSAGRKTAAKKAPARKTAAKKAGGRKAAAGRTDERGAIRAWARSQGLAVSDRGRVPQSILDAYRAAQR